jgi:acetyl esterase/lipase
MKAIKLTLCVFLLALLSLTTGSQASAQAVDYATDPHLSESVKQFLNALNKPGPGLETLPIKDGRSVLVNAQKSVQVDLSGIEVSEKTITQDGYTVKLNIVRPAGVKGILPVFIFIHGGGWVLGDFPTHERLVRDLVVLSGCEAVFPNYTPSPEARYPQAIHEIYAATKWVAEHGGEINVDGKRLAVAGNSVGGNMAAVTCLMAKDNNGPKIRFQLLLWPVTDATFDWPSCNLYGKQRFLTASLMKWMFDQYSTDPAQRKQPYYSPLNASLQELKGLPPALIQVAENDILRDQGEAYGRKLDEAGVKVTCVRFNGVIHDWGMLNGLANIPQTRALVVQGAAELKKYLK